MREYLMLWLEGLGIQASPLIVILIALSLIILFSIIIHLFLHHVVLRTIQKHYQKSPRLWSQLLLQHNLFNRLAFTLQGVIIYMQTQLWLTSDTRTYEIMLLCSQIWILIYALLAFFSVLDTLLSLLQHTKIMRQMPLRGIFQSVKLISAIMIGILIISLLLGRSPVILFSGLGAMTAVFMLVFKDPILGLVAGIQLSANNMLNVGDWLEMPKYGADGDVIDIGLTTVKVSNWDKTITTIPTYALISDSFKNWRGMTEAGGRRIKRSVNIDTSSIHFLTDEECERLRKAQLLLPYIDNKLEEINHYNSELQVDLSSSANGRRLTNIGTFRAYLQAYLSTHPGIHKEMTLMVRQLAPTPEGLPIEIYAFTNITAWAKYESIQSDIFDHILAVVGEFGLRVHQTPTGNDMRYLSGHLAATTLAEIR